MEIPSVYLDTCIISGIAKMDLPEEEISSLLAVLKHGKKGNLKIITSKVSKDEINKIPIEYRQKHELIYYLLTELPYVHNFRNVWQNGTIIGVGVGVGFGHYNRKIDPTLSKLRSLLPHKNDALHIFQAIKNKSQYFLTTDYKTIIKFRNKIEEIHKIKIVSPIELDQLLSN